MARILVFGTGNVGAVYSLFLHRAGVAVICVCRSNFDAASKHGLKVQSTVFGEHTFFPIVASSLQQAIDKDPSTPFDFVVDCTKTSPTLSSAPSLISAAITPLHTTIVVIKNGIGVEQAFRDKFPQNAIISGVTYLPTSQVRPGVVSHTETQKLHVGLFPASDKEQSHQMKLELFASLMNLGGAEITVHDDVQVERWKKLIGNATWNPICALSRCRDVQFLQASDLAAEFLESAMNEVVAVAAVLGYKDSVQASAVQIQLERSVARSWPGVEPSMLSDVREERSMEVQAIVGEVVKLGREYAVDVRRLETLYVLLMGLEWATQNQESVKVT